MIKDDGFIRNFSIKNEEGIHTSSLTILDILKNRATETPNNIAYIYINDDMSSKKTLTYLDLYINATQIAKVIQKNTTKEDRVLLLYPPGIEFISAFFGCLYANTIAVPAYPPKQNRTLERIELIAKDCKASLICSTKKCINNSKNIKSKVSSCLNEIPWLSTDTIIHMTTPFKPSHSTQINTAFIQYTSGSTSDPKGVIISHKNIIENQKMIKNGFQHNDKSIIAGWLPIYHDMGLIGNILQPLYIGRPLYQISPTTFLQNPITWLQIISQYRATTSGAPNFAYDLCCDKIDDDLLKTLDLSSWQIAFNGSEPIKHKTFERFAQKFKKSGFNPDSFFPCYGMAETTLFVSGNKKPKTTTINREALKANKFIPTTQTYGSIKIVSSGNILTQEKQTIQIINPKTNKKCEPNTIGEIWVHGPHVSSGYWNKKNVTKQTFSNKINNNQSKDYLRTGDLGYIDSSGNLYITGRLKDTIIIHGKNHYPQDIEDTVENSHEALTKGACAAFSITINDCEKLVIISELKRTHRHQKSFTEIFNTINKRLSQSHSLSPHAIILISPLTLLKTSSGKIQRQKNKQYYLENKLKIIKDWNQNKTEKKKNSNKNIIKPTTHTEEIIHKIWSHSLGLTTLCITDNFFDIGGSSLTSIEIINQIETEFAITLEHEKLFENPTIKTLSKLVTTLQINMLSQTNHETLSKLISQMEPLTTQTKERAFSV